MKGGHVPATQPIRFGIMTGQSIPWPRLVERWQEAEALGFDTAWVTDHFMSGGDSEERPYYECWTVLAGLAAVSSRIRFGVMVTGNTYRNPALLAKEAVTVEHISGGRLELGVGAGWWEREHLAYGYPFPGKRELVDRFGEALEILDLLQTQHRPSYQGTYYALDETPFEPKPLQQPRIPLLIGAGGPRMLALTAKHADIWNTRAPVDGAVERSQLLDAKCRAIGRDPAAIMRSIWPFQHPFTSLDTVREVVASYRAHGFTDFLFGWPSEPEHEAIMREAARELLPELREQGS
jgi:F420-dependent oxidoreductase-like protein